ncbi:hypothetical protein DSO57_1039473 [Entomophthora muscae]|uniref:Uncharacterized protein n=1 Tax=Entomophthora muscae TaxID=34485 RepID=A0ACC2TX41_9FUNG|nr:hypothetical protein DSO57_1039473 [Entomophthora muscae]
MHLNLVTSKPHRQDILDLGDPGVINPSYLVKKLKLAPDLTYHNNSVDVGHQTAKFFLAMDLISGYWKIDLPPAAKRSVPSLPTKGCSSPQGCPKVCPMPWLPSKGL